MILHSRSVTVFEYPFARFQSNVTARVPLLVGNMEGDGTIWALGYPSLRAVLQSYLHTFAANVTDDQVRALYPGQNETQIMASAIRDIQYRWCVEPIIVDRDICC